MIYFLSDYSQGAHPAVMEALVRTNTEHSDGYGTDEHCRRAAAMIKEMIGREDCGVHMMVGGTPCNITVIAAALRPYEAVIALKTGHIYSHETGAIEATGHRVTAMEGVNGKLTPELIDLAFEEHQDEHTLLPKMVYISQPTECGSLYSKAELTAIHDKCHEKNMYLYADGARLGAALTCERNDLSLPELAQLCDLFYIGGTKNGALFGEALVICRPEIDDHFRYMIKRQGGLLARGRLIGVQLEALLEGGENSLYFKTAAHANKMAQLLREGLSALGIEFYSDSPTNQVFPILPRGVAEELKKEFAFHEWAPERDGMVPIRLVTAWGTEERDVERLVERVKQLYHTNLRLK